MIIGDLVDRMSEPASFSDKGVEDDLLMKIMEAARLAPSASNTQTWRFFIVRESGLLKSISGLVKKESFGSAPVVIAAFSEPFMLGRKAKEQPFFMIDIPIAISHILLMATELGLSASVEFEFNEKMVVDLIRPPKNYRAVALIAMGYAGGAVKRVAGGKKASIEVIMRDE